MSPEAIRDRQYSMAGDVFMFGVCLWEMVRLMHPPHSLTRFASVGRQLTLISCGGGTQVTYGGKPWQGLSAAQVIGRVLSGATLADPPYLPPDCDTVLAKLMRRCWAMDPARRCVCVCVVHCVYLSLSHTQQDTLSRISLQGHHADCAP